MMKFYGTYKSPHTLAIDLLAGEVDLSVFAYLHGLAIRDGMDKFKTLNPLEHFEFEIEFTDEQDLLVINQVTIHSCSNWSNNFNNLERKVIILLAAIIRNQYEEILYAYRHEADEEPEDQSVF